MNRVAITAKAKVLLVQSAQTQGNGTRRFLEHSGYEVVWAGSGMSAQMAAKNQQVNVILLDFALPDIEGSDLCKRFRSRDETKALPIILLTARGSAPESFARPPAGPDDYLAKPFTEAELDNRIMSLLKAISAKRAAAAASAAEKMAPAAEVAERLTDEQLAPMEENPQQTSEPTQPRQAPAIVAAAKPQQAPRASTSIPVGSWPEPERKRPHQNMVDPPERGSIPDLPRPVAVPQIIKSAAQPAAKPDPAVVKKPAAETVQADPSHMGTMAEVVDSSTGLFTRLQFEAMFSKEFKRSMRFKQQMSCMMIDLDGKSMGRIADEQLVKAIIKLVQNTIREVDTAAWWTGDALVVMLPNTLRNDAVQAAARILETVANHPFTWPDATRVTMSIGVAGLPDKNIDNEQKMTAAAASACKRARELMLPFERS